MEVLRGGGPQQKAVAKKLQTELSAFYIAADNAIDITRNAAIPKLVGDEIRYGRSNS